MAHLPRQALQARVGHHRGGDGGDNSCPHRFALEVGMVALTGMTDAGHMREDLDIFDFRLEPGEVEGIEALA